MFFCTLNSQLNVLKMVHFLRSDQLDLSRIGRFQVIKSVRPHPQPLPLTIAHKLGSNDKFTTKLCNIEFIKIKYFRIDHHAFSTTFWALNSCPTVLERYCFFLRVVLYPRSNRRRSAAFDRPMSYSLGIK